MFLKTDRGKVDAVVPVDASVELVRVRSGVNVLVHLGKVFLSLTDILAVAVPVADACRMIACQSNI